MRTIIQRVSEAAVRVDGAVVGAIGRGLLVLAGVEEGDTREDVRWLAGKIARLRIFPDADGLMNRSVVEAKGQILVVSQFTLHASTRKGNRPSFIRAARPEVSEPLCDELRAALEAETAAAVASGRFGAHMQVSLVNDGPVTLVIDSRLRE